VLPKRVAQTDQAAVIPLQCEVPEHDRPGCVTACYFSNGAAQGVRANFELRPLPSTDKKIHDHAGPVYETPPAPPG